MRVLFVALHESGFGTKRPTREVRVMVAIGGKTDIKGLSQIGAKSEPTKPGAVFRDHFREQARRWRELAEQTERLGR
jgi:hypothetical protein